MVLTLDDQSRSVTLRPFVHRSSEKAQTSLTCWPSFASLLSVITRGF